MNKVEEAIKENTTTGTSKRKCFYAGAFFLTGLLLVLIGFWKTLFVAVLTAVGAFIGASDNVAESLKKAINKAFPPAQKVVTYTAEETEKVKKALSKKESDAVGEQEEASADSEEQKA